MPWLTELLRDLGSKEYLTNMRVALGKLVGSTLNLQFSGDIELNKPAFIRVQLLRAVCANFDCAHLLLQVAVVEDIMTLAQKAPE